MSVGRRGELGRQAPPRARPSCLGGRHQCCARSLQGQGRKAERQRHQIIGATEGRSKKVARHSCPMRWRLPPCPPAATASLALVPGALLAAGVQARADVIALAGGGGGGLGGAALRGGAGRVCAVPEPGQAGHPRAHVLYQAGARVARLLGGGCCGAWWCSAGGCDQRARHGTKPPAAASHRTAPTPHPLCRRWTATPWRWPCSGAPTRSGACARAAAAAGA